MLSLISTTFAFLLFTTCLIITDNILFALLSGMSGMSLLWMIILYNAKITWIE